MKNQKEEPKQDLEKEMFDLEQELDIPSNLRWHNSKPKQETLLQIANRKLMSNDWLNGAEFGAKWQQEQDKNKYSEEDKIMSFLDTEYKLGISDKKTIERLKWYFKTYF